MKRLLDDLAAQFDLDYRVRGVPLLEWIKKFDFDLDKSPLQDWGTPGPESHVATVSPGPVYLYYVPHLFPGMDPKLRLAHQLQYHLLPQEVPEGAPVSIAAVLESYCHLSGDLFGWKKTADGQFFMWIVDLAGHGLETGLACAVVRAIIDNVDDRGGVGEMVGELNEAFTQSLRPGGKQMFATGFFMKLTVDGEARYCSAGHPPAMWIDLNREIRPLWPTSRPIGLFPAQVYDVEKIRLEKGDTLFFYTDGLVELSTRAGKQFGLARLREFLKGARQDPAALNASLYREIALDHDLTQLDDDVTFVAAQMLGR